MQFAITTIFSDTISYMYYVSNITR